MKILVFAKNRLTKEGKPFNTYIAKLTKTDGSEVTAALKFREECGQPKAAECPCYIDVDKKDANFNTKQIELKDEAGNVTGEATQNTLWIQKWTMNPEKYVDHSMDDFV